MTEHPMEHTEMDPFSQNSEDAAPHLEPASSTPPEVSDRSEPEVSPETEETDSPAPEVPQAQAASGKEADSGLPPASPEEEARDKELDSLKKWFVVHTLSGHEQKVRNNLLKRIDTMNMKKKIFSVLVPTEEEVEIKNGKKRIVQRKIYPGYVMVEMIMGDDSWYVVRNTAGVTGFVGSGTKPLPLPEEEVKQLLKQVTGEAPKRRLTLKTGDKVRVTSGPFVEFYGAIQEVNPEKEKIKVAVSIFGRETPVELDYGQVEKL